MHQYLQFNAIFHANAYDTKLCIKMKDHYFGEYSNYIFLFHVIPFSLHL